MASGNTGGPAREFSATLRDVTYGSGCTVVHPSNLYECTLGDDVFVGPFTEVQSNVSIGSRTRIQSHVFLCSLVTVGEDSFLGHGVKCINDRFSDFKIAFTDEAHKWEPTTIGSNVLIGTNATILPVTICDNVVIGAGSVVTRDITEPGYYMGVPAVKCADPPSKEDIAIALSQETQNAPSPVAENPQTE